MNDPASQIDEAQRTQSQELLHEAGIWEFSSYGWLNADDIDSEFVGHAMWQTDPPLDHLRVFGNRAAATQPIPFWQRLSAINGADFVGLMQASRMSIGLFLVQAKLARDNQFNKEDLFDLHWMSSIIYLSTASDRMRSLFIAAVFRKEDGTYAKGRYNGQQRRLYVTPFVEAIDTLANGSDEVKDALTKTSLFAEQIRQLRDTRNEIIHDLATAMGRRERLSVDQQASEAADPEEFDYEALRKAIEASEDAHKKRLSETTTQLAAWYELLVRAANEVFIVENRLRSMA